MDDEPVDDDDDGRRDDDDESRADDVMVKGHKRVRGFRVDATRDVSFAYELHVAEEEGRCGEAYQCDRCRGPDGVLA